jgi:hypothetical protein
MKFATLILTHANPELTADTVDAIQTWVGEHVLVLVDQIGWPQFQNVKIGSARVEEGFLHAHNRSPYRNAVLGLKRLYEYWPDSDWFLYSEYDCLFTSSVFQEDLQQATNRNAWVVGSDLRRFDFQLPLLQDIINQKNIKYSYYFLGCCQFLHNKLVSKLYETKFLDNFLEQTKNFEKGYFPHYDRWAFEEELWATIAAHLGGSLYELSCWKSENGDWQGKINDPNMIYAGKEHGLWRGKFRLYPIRNSPKIDIDMKLETSIAHPIKTISDPIRLYQKNVRRQTKKRRFLL